MSRDELQRQSLEAALGDVGLARVEFDDVAGWLAAAGASPIDPLAAEVWVFDPDLTQVLLVLHPWRGWVPPGGKDSEADARRDIFRWIAFYNHRRRHSALGYRSPAEYERTLDPTTLLPIAA